VQAADVELEMQSCEEASSSVSGRGSATAEASSAGARALSTGDARLDPLSVPPQSSDDDEGWGEDDDEDREPLRRLKMPKLTDDDFASAFRKARASSWTVRKEFAIDDGIPARTKDGEDVLIFGGIIDILQVYGARKKLEHRYKSMRYRSERAGISVTNPTMYAQRMANFLWSKFQLEPLPPKDKRLTDFAEEETSMGTFHSTGAMPPCPPTVTGIGSAPPSHSRLSGGGGAEASSSVSNKATSVIRASSSTKLSSFTRRGNNAAAADLTSGVVAGETPLVVGTLQKRSSSFPYKWMDRYAEVYASTCTLVYWSSQGDCTSQPATPRGKRQLRSVNRYLAPSPPGDALVLEVTLTSGKEMLIRLPAEADRDRWFDALTTLLHNTAAAGEASAL